MEVPLHTLMKLTPKAYGTEVEKIKADIPAVSTWRPKGSTAKHHDSVSEGMPEIVVGEVAGTKTEVKQDSVPKVTMGDLPLP